MDVLRDIAYVLDRHQVRYVEVLTNPQPTRLTPKRAKDERRYHEFYVGLKDDRWPTEAAAAASFGMKPGDSRFRKFKNETMKRLVNSMLFLGVDQPDKLSFEYTLQETTRLQAVLQMLGRRMAKRAFFQLAGYTLKRAESIEHLAAMVDILRIMKSLSAHHTEYRKFYDQWRDKYQYYRDALAAEHAARDAYEDFIAPLAHTKGIQREQAQRARAAWQTVVRLGSQFPHHNLHYYITLLDYYACVFDGNWKGAMAPLNHMNSLLQAKKCVSHNTIVLLHSMTAYVLMMQRQYDQAGQQLDAAWNYAVEGAPNWFKIRELYTSNALYARDFKTALTEVQRCYQHKRFSNISATDQDTWQIFGGYLHLLALTGKIKGISSDELEFLKKFKTGKTLNATSWYSIDKQGGNIPRQLLQIVTLIIEIQADTGSTLQTVVKTDRMIQTIETMRRYCIRHLGRQEVYERTALFIKLLQLLPRYHHMPVKLRQKAHRYLPTLATLSATSFEIEVLSYEFQWQWIIELLENKSPRIHNNNPAHSATFVPALAQQRL